VAAVMLARSVSYRDACLDRTAFSLERAIIRILDILCVVPR
jgi:hypothetical protein